jgi:vancomycin resistance protein VanJ
VVLAPWAWFAVRGLHPWLDLVAITLPVLVVVATAVVALAVVATRCWWGCAVVASLLAFGATSVVGPWRPQAGPPPQRPLVLVSANVSHPEDRATAEIVHRSLLATGADVLVTVELRPVLAELLAQDFPYRATSLRSDQFDPPPAVGIFSRYPVTDVRSDARDVPGARAIVHGPGGDVMVYAVHVPKPSLSPSSYSVGFRRHDQLDAAVAASAAREALPVVIAGDLNTSDRTIGYRRFTSRFVDAARTGWAGPTSVKASPLWRLLALRVDHVFLSRSWCAAGAGHRPLAGSDHRAVRVEIGPCVAPAGPDGDRT